VEMLKLTHLQLVYRVEMLNWHIYSWYIEWKCWNWHIYS